LFASSFTQVIRKEKGKAEETTVVPLLPFQLCTTKQQVLTTEETNPESKLAQQ